MHAIILSALLFSFSIKIVPGPNNFMLLNSGLNYGIKKSLPFYLGVCLGIPLLVLVVALGCGAVFIRYHWLEVLLKGMGSTYMLYLAYQIGLSHTKAREGHLVRPFGFFKAIAFQWVNPKAWVMAIGAVSLFTISANLYLNAFILGAIFIAMCIPALGFWLFGGACLQKILKSDQHRRCFNLFMALCLVASALMILLR